MTTTNAQRAGQGQALVQTGSGPLAVVKWGMTADQVELLKRTICRGSTDDEFALFMTVAQKMGLDPFTRQIHAVKRYDSSLKREVMAIQVGIDGYRLQACRTEQDDGQEGPYWCGADGVWHDAWLSTDEAPRAAKVLVYRKGRARPYVGVALWASYVQLTKEGDVTHMWRTHGPGQLAKCAEALALRKAFPAELAGTHTDDEMPSDAIDVEFTEVKASPASPPAAAGPASAGSPPTSSGGSQAGIPAAAPAASPAPVKAPPPEDKRPLLTEDEIITIIEDISRCGTRGAVSEIVKARINNARLSDEQRGRLLRASNEQLAEIKRAEAAEKSGAP